MNMTLTDENGKTWELVTISRNRPDQDVAVIRRIPEPPAKETYYINMWKFGNNFNVDLYDQKIALTKDQAEALAKAVEALISYVQEPRGLEAMRHLTDRALDARAAIQDGSAA